VDDIQIHPRDNDLVIGTHGRSVWIMDDIAPLEELASTPSDKVHTFSVRPATIVNTYSPQGWTGDGEFATPNPPEGAQIRYFVPPDVAFQIKSEKQESAGDPAEIRILDATGGVIRRLKGKGDAGVQSLAWDLRLEPPYEADPNAAPAQGRGGRGGGGAPVGPRVLPGSYKVQVALGGATSETTLEVRGDPRISITPADLAARQEVLMKIYRISKPAYEAGVALDRIDRQVEDVQQLLKTSNSGSEGLRRQVDALREEIAEIQRGPAARARGAGQVQGSIENATRRPTAHQVYQVDEAVGATTEAVEKVNELITRKLPELYQALNREGIRPSPGQPVEPPRGK
jgi:hypothetical protein